MWQVEEMDSTKLMTCSINYIFGTGQLLKSAICETVNSLRAYWQLIRHVFYPVVFVLARLYLYCMPFVTKLVQGVALRVLSQPRHVLIFEIFTLIAVLCFIVIMRNLRRILKPVMASFGKCQSRVSAKSKAARMVFPHALYFVGVSSIHFFIIGKATQAGNGPKFGLSKHVWGSLFSSYRAIRTVGVVLTAVFWPVLQSLALVMNYESNAKVVWGSPIHIKNESSHVMRKVASNIHSDVDIDEKDSSSSDANQKMRFVSAERQVLRVWVAIAMIWIIRCSIHMLCPSVSLFHRMLSAGDVWLLYVIVWTQLGLTSGANILYAVLLRFMSRKGLVRLPRRTVQSSCGREWGGLGAVFSSDDMDSSSRHKTKRKEAIQQLGILMRIVKSLQISHNIRSHRVWRFLCDSGLAVGLFLVFGLTPRPLTFLATVVAGIIWPCIRTVSAIEADDVDDDGNVDDESSSPSSSLDEGSSANSRRRKWLGYWVVYASLELAYTVLGARLSWIPLWLHFKVAAVFWLQADDFAGTSKVLHWTMPRIGFLVSSFNWQMW